MQPNGGRDGQRIICMRCQANNFLGQTNCWQCGNPLPPPDSAMRPSPSRQNVGPNPLAAPVSRPVAASAPSRPNALLFVGIAALTFVVVLLAAIRMRQPTTQSQSSAAPLSPGPNLLPQGTNTAVAPPAPAAAEGTAPAASNAGTTGDPLTDAARRVIDRESNRLGLPPAAGAVSPDGRIHLRSGGSISPEEWNAARSKLQSSPLLNGSPVPPGF